jgi:hypothetical protein
MPLSVGLRAAVQLLWSAHARQVLHLPRLDMLSEAVAEAEMIAGNVARPFLAPCWLLLDQKDPDSWILCAVTTDSSGKHTFWRIKDWPCP